MSPARSARPALSLALLVLVAATLLLVPVAAVCAPHALEDATGESDPLQQAKAAGNLLRQRPVATSDFTPVEHTEVYPIGANTFLEQEVEEWKVRQTFEMLRDAGVKWIRQEFPWDRIEQRGKGNFEGDFGSNWQAYDRIVAYAQEYGIEVVPRLTLPPNWTRRDNSTPRAPPDNYDDYGDFVAEVVRRYQGRVHYYQLWNEPNTVLEWGAPPNAADFVRLLQVGYSRAKGVDPSLVILAPALSPTIGTPEGSNINDLTFLQEMYDAGAARWFDVMSAQGYGLWTGPGDRRADEYRTNFSRVQLVREVMVQNGDGHKPIWLAEVGWAAVPPDFPGEAIHGRVTEDQQARYTLAGLRRIQDEWPWVGVTFLWHFRKVSDEQRDQAEFYFRLVDPDFTPRPVYFAVQQVAQDPPALHYGWQPANDWSVVRQGAWRAAAESVDGARVTALVSSSDQASLTLAFKGRGLAVQWTGQPGAVLAGSVDGALPAVISGGQAGPDALQVSTVAAGLAEGYHSVVLKPGGGAEVAVAGFLVAGRDGTPADGWIGAGLLALAAVATLGVLVMGRRA